MKQIRNHLVAIGSLACALAVSHIPHAYCLGILHQDTIEKCLKSEPVVDVVSLSSYLKKKGTQVTPTHHIQLITLENDIQGVFKTGNYHYAEVAAYRLSKILGLNLVPPTVFRSINGVQGSLQLYIDAPDLASVSDRHKMFKRVGTKAVSDMKVFYYVAGQWDTHAGNQIITKDDGNALWLIDNSGILHRSYSRYGGETFIEKGENFDLPSDTGDTFPFDKVISVKGDYNKLLPIFSPYLSKGHIRGLSKHTKLAYAIWNHTLWLKRETDGPHRVSRITKRYYTLTLEALRGLSKEDLEQVWSEWLCIEPEHGDELIRLILERRDEILVAAQSGIIIVG